MSNYVLDSNAIAAVINVEYPLVERYYRAIADQGVFLGCAMIYYEVKRGLIAKKAPRKMKFFEELFKTFVWQEYTSADWNLAAELWAKRRALGRPISDSDLMIAVFTRNRDAILVTRNLKDFEQLDVSLENRASA